MASGELPKRIAVAAIGIPLAVVLIYLGGWALGAVLVVVAVLGAAEIYKLAALRQVKAYRGLGAVLAAAIVAFAVIHEFPGPAAPYQWTAVLTAVLVLAALSVWARGIEGAPLEASAITVFGAVFVGGSLIFAVYLRNLAPQLRGVTDVAWAGAALVAYPLAVTWVGDTLAYFFGSRWGRHKLTPVSPKKSWEGAIAGFAGSVAAGALFGWLVFGVWLGLGIGVGSAALGGAVIAPIAQVGDLAESLLKREAQVKDSGSLLPGHGGVLDRFDALFYALPVAWVYLTWVVPLIQESPWR
jgi:phosphatidate cytidylyltransferase